MENRENIIKAMGICMEPGCSEACPYHGKSNGTKSCRAVLLEEALAELVGLMADNENLNSEMDDLEAANNTLRAERDGLRLELEEKRPALKAAQVENDILHQRCQVQQNEINVLLLKNGEKDAKTDRPSVGIESTTAYWCGRADALAEVVGHCFAGEAPCK